MAEKKTIEVIVGTKEGKADKEGKVEKVPSKQEVGGRWHSAAIECPHSLPPTACGREAACA